MKTLRIMDSTGDTVLQFDETAATEKATGEAKALFERMSKGGGAVFAVNRADGQPDKKVTNFGELEADNIVVPRIVGG